MLSTESCDHSDQSEELVSMAVQSGALRR
jgi:hypothetical protein